VEAIAYRYRTGIPWRDLPREVFGPWQTVWKRHKKFAYDGTWDRVLAALTAQADAQGEVDWVISVAAKINRPHHHATDTTHPQAHTAGRIEWHESGPRQCPQRAGRSRHRALPRRADQQDPSCRRRARTAPGGTGHPWPKPRRARAGSGA